MAPQTVNLHELLKAACIRILEGDQPFMRGTGVAKELESMGLDEIMKEAWASIKGDKRWVEVIKANCNIGDPTMPIVLLGLNVYFDFPDPDTGKMVRSNQGIGVNDQGVSPFGFEGTGITTQQYLTMLRNGDIMVLRDPNVSAAVGPLGRVGRGRRSSDFPGIEATLRGDTTNLGQVTAGSLEDEFDDLEAPTKRSGVYEIMVMRSADYVPMGSEASSKASSETSTTCHVGSER
ncbi:uncharacterized protein BP5553_01356 [Venustampulla echinocandica]|uniref:Uncharacterized protein n=1 Tax=Venustampulla echinocandica TaxID=2656787 RepID=A0A370U0T4_9HELO|nr:uncharacterized protein BP5553_01356 [Venustampulla echinocandica]RDL41377.1 hypothetical protein BP5553_01356 [Venustampulla echinocandica]